MLNDVKYRYQRVNFNSISLDLLCEGGYVLYYGFIEKSQNFSFLVTCFIAFCETEIRKINLKPLSLLVLLIFLRLVLVVEPNNNTLYLW